MMKKLPYYTTVLLFFVGIFVAAAQPDMRQSKEKIKKLKIAYFTENLGLTSAEAQKFWPVYNAFEDKNHELRVQKFSKIKQEVRDLEQMSEAEAKTVLDRLEKLEDEIRANDKALITRLKTILPAKKIIRLKKAERDFNRKLFKQFRHKRGKQIPIP